MSKYFCHQKPSGKAKVELDLSNYTTKTNLKNATENDTSSFSKKFDLSSLKFNVYELYIHKIKKRFK